MSHHRVKLQNGKTLLGFRIIKCIGSGGYGDTYYVVRTSDNMPFAMKVERTNARKQALEGEVEFFRSLRPSPYLPQFVDFGEEGPYRVLVLELLGPGFDKLARTRPEHTFSIESVLRLSVEMLRAIQAFHVQGFIHNDIKPDNFLLKLNSDNFVCLIDFGLSKKYLDDSGEHVIRDLLGDKFRGTIAFSSPGMMRTHDTARRDDLFSWFYAVMILLLGKLPWIGEKKMKRVQRMKRHIRDSELYQAMPKCYQESYEYISTLKFYDAPDYERIISAIQEEINERNIEWNSPYDWEMIPDDVARQISAFPLAIGKEVRPFCEDEVVDKASLEARRQRSTFRKNRDQVGSQTCLLV